MREVQWREQKVSQRISMSEMAGINDFPQCLKVNRYEDHPDLRILKAWVLYGSVD